MFLRIGSRGNDVKSLQVGLHIMNFSTGSMDGIFGSKVLEAVKSFQKSNALAADGIVGDSTWNVLVSKIKPIEEALSKKGFAIDKIDGVATITTYNALLNFQRINKLFVDGIAGTNTKKILFASNSEATSNSGNKKNKKIFIDAGHGGKDPGSVGNGLREKDITLSIALKLGQILTNSGFDVYYSRKTDVFLDLQEIVRRANSTSADLFISIHTNAFNAQSNGTESFTKTTAINRVKDLSRNIANALSSKLSLVNRGHKEANFTVIKYANMPALLVESAFITNYNDALKLRDRQDEFANIIANEIVKMFS